MNRPVIKFLSARTGKYEFATVDGLGDIALLQTRIKTDIVSAINELIVEGISGGLTEEDRDRINDIGNSVDSLKNGTFQITEWGSVDEYYQDKLNATIEIINRSNKETIELEKEQVREIIETAISDYEQNVADINVLMESARQNVSNAEDLLAQKAAELETANIDYRELTQVVDVINGVIQDKVQTIDFDLFNAMTTDYQTLVTQTAQKWGVEASLDSLSYMSGRVESNQASLEVQNNMIQGKVGYNEWQYLPVNIGEYNDNLLKYTRDLTEGWERSNTAIYVTSETFQHTKIAAIEQNGAFYHTSNSDDLEVGRTYVASIWVNIQERNKNATDAKYAPNNTIHEVNLMLGTESNVTEIHEDLRGVNGWAQHYVTFVADESNPRFAPRISFNHNTQIAYMTAPKLEEGLEVTGWQPHVDDDYATIYSSHSLIRQQGNEIATFVNEVKVLEDSYQEATSSFSQIADGFELNTRKIEEYEETVLEYGSQVKAFNDSFSAKVWESDFENVVSDINIDNRNRVFNSAFDIIDYNEKTRETDIVFWDGNDGKITKLIGEHGTEENHLQLSRTGVQNVNITSMTSNKFKSRYGERLIFSFNSIISGLDADNIFALEIFDISDVRLFKKEFSLTELTAEPLANGVVRYSGSYTIAHEDTAKARVVIQLPKNGNININKLLVQGADIGTTDWTPAPEDSQLVRSRQEAEISVLKDEIGLRVTKESIDQSSGLVINEEGNITINPATIIQRVTNVELLGEEALINGTIFDQKVDGWRQRLVQDGTVINDINASPGLYQINFDRVAIDGELLARMISTYDLDIAHGFRLVNGNIPIISANAVTGEIEMNVSKLSINSLTNIRTVDGETPAAATSVELINTWIEQDAESVAIGAVGRELRSSKDNPNGEFSEVWSEIKVAKDNFELAVSKDGVIQSINGSAEGLKIDFEKVNITGQLLAAIISSEKIDVTDNFGIYYQDKLVFGVDAPTQTIHINSNNIMVNGKRVAIIDDVLTVDGKVIDLTGRVDGHDIRLTNVDKEVDAAIAEAKAAKLAAEKAYEDAIEEAEAKVQAKDKEYKLIFEEYDSTVEAIEADSQTAKTKAEQALTDVGISTDLAQTAKDLATTAETNSGNAITQAGEALSQVVLNKGLVETANSLANEAKSQASEAISQVGLNKDLVTEAKTQSDQAVAEAQEASTSAQAALTDAQTALSTAKSANTKSGQAETAANTAKTNAQTALDDAKTALSTAKSADTKSGLAETAANTAKTNAQTALDNSRTAITNASNAITKAGQAETTANTAKTNAQTALDKSNTAITDAADAITKAGLAETTANTAKTNAQTAIDDAKSALTEAGNAKTTADTLSVKVDDLEGEVELKASQTEVDGISGTVSTHTTTLSQQATAIASKADKTVVDTLSGTVSNQGTLITQNATAISSKASSELVNTIKDTVDTHATEISQNATDIASKASSTSVSNLTGRVKTAETTITQHATSIASKASQTEVDTVKGTVSGHTTTLSQHAKSISSKAESELVDTIKGTVDTHTTEISQNATDIASKASSTSVNALTGRVGTAESNITQNATAITQRVTTNTYNAGIASKENTVLKQSTAPTHVSGRLWLDTSVTPNVLKRSNGTTWIKATPTTPGEVGAYSQSDGAGLAGRLTTAETSITQTATAITSKADKSTVDTLAGTVSTQGTTITQQATLIASKANQTEVDTVKGTVSGHTTTISQHATQIASKAEKKLVDTIKGTVDTHTTDIRQNATDISSKANTATVNTLAGRVDTAESNITQNATAISQRVTTTTYNTGIGSKENTVLKQSSAPTHVNGRLWLDTSVTPNILKRSTGTAWVKATPTTPGEVGAYSQADGAGLAGRLTTAETNITQTATAITSKADKSVVDTLAGTVSAQGTTITQNATAITSKANQKEVDTVKGTVSGHTTTLSQHATAIASKAESSLVNTIKGTVDTHTTEIGQNATDIASKASSSSVSTLTGRVSTAESNISQNATAITQRVTTTTYNTGIGSKENSVLKQTTAPAHLNGRLWLDTSVTPNVLKRSTGTAWVKATPTTAAEVGAYSSSQGSALAGRVTTAETNITQTSTAITSKADKSVVDTLSGTVSTHGTTLTQHATAISSKAAQTEVDTVKGTVAGHTTTISQHATKIASKAESSLVNTIKGTVDTHTTEISQNATDIASKASATSVNTLTGTVSGHTTAISQNATAIASKASSSSVNSLTGRVSTAETTITQHGTAITSKASQQEVNTVKGTVSGHTTLISQNATAISARLTSAQVNSLVDGKGFATQTWANNQITASANGIRADMTKVEGKIDGLQVGGRNYWALAKSPWFSYLKHLGDGVFTNTSTITSFAFMYMRNLGVDVGEEYTLSFEIKVTDASIQFSDNAIYINSLVLYVPFNRPTLVKDKWVKVFSTFNYSAENTTAAHMYFNNIPSSNSIEFRNFKLEKGNIVTDWTPAPEDTMMEDDFNVFKASYEATAQALTSRLTAIDKTGGRLATAESNISQNATGLTQRYTKTETNNLLTNKANASDLNGLATQTWTTNQITTSANGTKQEITRVENKIPSLTGYATQSWTNTQITTKAGEITTSLTTEINKKATPAQITNAILSDKNILDTRSANQTPAWYFTNHPNRVVREFKNTSTMGIGAGTYGVLTTDVPWSGLSGGTVKQSFLDTDGVEFIRRGTTTTWTAWETMSTNTYVNTTVTQKAGEVTQLITQVKTNPTGTITGYNSLVNNVNSMVQAIGTNGGKIAQMVMTDSSFSTKVLSTVDVGGRNLLRYSDSFSLATIAAGITATIQTDNTRKFVTVSGNGNYASVGFSNTDEAEAAFKEGDDFTVSLTIKRTAGSGKPSLYIKSGMGYYELLGNLTSEWSTLYYTGKWKKVNPISIHIGWGGTSGTFFIKNVKLEKGNVVTAWTPSPEDKANQSQVTQLAGSWALTLKSGNDIKTQINAATDSIRLSSKFIHLNGSSLIDQATIKSAHIDTLNANKITGNTADFNKIRTGVLTADVVTATHIKADTALFDTLFSTTSATDRLVARGAWIENANIKNLDASKINAGTINAARISTSSLNNVELGGTNLYNGSSYPQRLADFYPVATATYGIGDGSLIKNCVYWTGAPYAALPALNKELVVGKTYTLSFYAKSSKNGVTSSSHIYINPSNSIPNSAITYNYAWKRYKYTFTVKGSGTGVRVHLYPNLGSGDHFYLADFQLEEGSVMTAYSPAPEDDAIDLARNTGRVEIHGGNIKASTIDVGKITGDTAKFVSLSFESLNSNMKLNAGAIRLQNSAGDFASMNTIPEFRSQDSAGTAAIMGKGRSHYYSGNQARFYIGSNLEGVAQYGIHIAKGQTFGIYRNSDTYGGTPAQYYNTPQGWGAVQVVEELMRRGLVTNNFTTASAHIRALNGWGSSWPVLQIGEPVMYKAAVAGNSSGVETLWSMGTSSSGVTRLYSYPEHVFDYRIEVKGRARFIAQALFENNFVNNSDRRIKHDIKGTEVTALDHLDSLTFKEYKLNSTGKKVLLGLIAQDSGILRVKGEDEGDYEGIDGMMMPMLAMKGVQELHAIVKEQAEKIKQLEEKINK